MRQVFAGGASDIQNSIDFFWQIRGDKLKPEQIERVLKFWEAALAWAQAEPDSNDVLLSRLSRLAVYLSTLDDRAMSLLRPVVAHIHSDYSTDQMIEELARLSDTNPAGTVELLETMFAERTPVFDLDDKLKGLLKKLYSQGHQTEVFRIIEKLQKTLPEMLPFTKNSAAGQPRAKFDTMAEAEAFRVQTEGQLHTDTYPVATAGTSPVACKAHRG
jgi:hypothetical protein